MGGGGAGPAKGILRMRDFIYCPGNSLRPDLCIQLNRGFFARHKAVSVNDWVT